MNIALLTPYSGGNLGDAAIQEAVLATLRKRYPSAELWLVTLLPDRTTKLHGVPSFPINRFVQWQDAASPGSSTAEGSVRDGSDLKSTESEPGWFGRLKRALKSSPRVHSALKPLHDTLWPAYDELIHIRRTYEFLKTMDLLIVSGGGQLDELWGGPWSHPYALFKWALISKLARSRLVVLSVGTCALESNLSVFFIRHALRLASYRSYRDRTSKDLLESLPFTRNDEVYPDLAFSYSDDETMGRPEADRDANVVGVSPIAYLARRGWPKQNRAVYEPYFEALVGFVRALAKGGYSIVLFSTDSPDQEVVDDIVKTLEQEGDPLVLQRISHPRTHTLPELFQQLRRVDYVVASRLHGVLLSHRMGIPVLAISYDRKVDTHMKDVALTDHCVDIHGVTTEALVRAFQALTRQSPSIRSKLMEINDRYAHDLEHQYDVVLGSSEERGAS